MNTAKKTMSKRSLKLIFAKIFAKLKYIFYNYHLVEKFYLSKSGIFALLFAPLCANKSALLFLLWFMSLIVSPYKFGDVYLVNFLFINLLTCNTSFFCLVASCTFEYICLNKCTLSLCKTNNSLKTNNRSRTLVVF